MTQCASKMSTERRDGVSHARGRVRYCGASRRRIRCSKTSCGLARAWASSSQWRRKNRSAKSCFDFLCPSRRGCLPRRLVMRASLLPLTTDILVTPWGGRDETTRVYPRASPHHLPSEARRCRPTESARGETKWRARRVPSHCLPRHCGRRRIPAPLPLAFHAPPAQRTLLHRVPHASPQHTSSAAPEPRCTLRQNTATHTSLAIAYAAPLRCRVPG